MDGKDAARIGMSNMTLSKCAARATARFVTGHGTPTAWEYKAYGGPRIKLLRHRQSGVTQSKLPGNK